MADYRLFKNALIIDGNGGEPLKNGSLLVKDGFIEAVGPAEAVQAPDGAKVSDLGGRTLMPGHHRRSHPPHGPEKHGRPSPGCWTTPWYGPCAPYWDAWKVLDAGFTTARDCGGVNVGLRLKEAIEGGDIVGPQNPGRAAGPLPRPAATATPFISCRWKWSARSLLFGAHGRPCVVAQVRSRPPASSFRDGADFLKIMTTRRRDGRSATSPPPANSATMKKSGPLWKRPRTPW